MTMTIERQRSRIYAVRWVSVSVVLKLRTEIESDWISVEKPGGVLEAAGGKLRVAQGLARAQPSNLNSDLSPLAVG